MKSTRFVLGALVVTLHLHQTVQCAAAELAPAIPQKNSFNEVVIEMADGITAAHFYEQMPFVFASNAQYTEQQSLVQTTQKDTVTSLRKIAHVNNYVMSTATHTSEGSIVGNRNTPRIWKKRYAAHECEVRNCMKKNATP